MMAKHKQEYLPLYNMKSNGKPLGRTASVITDPQASVLEAVKENDLELLTDILTNEEFNASIDLNHKYDWAEQGNTLLHSAIEAENFEAVQLLIKRGVDCNLFNHRKVTGLHVAASKGQYETIRKLVLFGKADVNAVTESGETILHILARKSGLATYNANIYVKCLELALRFPNVDVDAKEHTASMTPLFIATDESRCRDAAVVLLRANADVNLTIDGIELKEALVKTFGGGILDHLPSDLGEAMKNLEVGNRTKLLQLLNESVVRDTLEEFKKELGQYGSSEDIIKAAPGVYNLLQVACEMGLDKHLEAMLQFNNVDVNFGNQTDPPLLIAALNAHGNVLKVLLEHDNTDIQITGDFGTVLHTLLSKPLPQKKYDEALDLVLSSNQAKKLKNIINSQDRLGNTALHHATQYWPQDIVKALLELGANIGLKNDLDEVPINRILPEVMEDFLNNHCLVPEGDTTHDKFKITAKFDFLVPFGTKLHKPGLNKVSDLSSETLDEVPLPETEGLWYMSQSKKHLHLLKHPVIATYLWMKWKKIQFAYTRNLLLFLTFVAFITSYIFVLYPGRDIRSDSIVQEQCNNADKVRGDVTFLWYANTICLIGLIIREFLQLGIAPRRYIFTLENWLEVTLIVLTSILLFDGDYSCHVQTKRHVAAFIIVLAWSEMIIMIGRHPKLTEVNIYVTMLFKVLWTFILFLTWYSLFIIAFALGFYILLHKDTGTEEHIEGHEYLFFDNFGLAIVKTFTMFVGELEFGDLPIETGFGYVFLLIFVFLIVVVLMNLLNGLAVSDTGVIRAEAETYAYKTQVEIISYIESTFLGDPFNFLANWPSFVWLRKIPTCSLVGGGRLYSVPQLRKMFHTLTGAKNIMLFQGKNMEHPNGFCVSFMPNQDHKYLYFLCSCCAPNDPDADLVNDLPPIIVESAKDAIVETIRVNAEEEDKNQLESRLARIESLLYKLLEKNN